MRRINAIIAALVLLETAAYGGYRVYASHNGPEVPEVHVPTTMAIGEAPVFLGKAEARYTLVEFGDYQCPPCAAAAPAVEKLIDQSQGKLKFVFRQYPLPFHEKAHEAAVAALSAKEAGKYYPVHRALYALNTKVDTGKIAQILKEAGVTSVTAKATATAEEQLLATKRDGDAMSLVGTPSFFLCTPAGIIYRLTGPEQATALMR